MKTIEVDEDLYRYIASQTLHIGESASDILRRLLNVDGELATAAPAAEPKGIVVSKDAAFDTKIDGVKAMRSLLISDEFAGLKNAIDRFMLILSTLHRIDLRAFLKRLWSKVASAFTLLITNRRCLPAGKQPNLRRSQIRRFG